MENENLFKEIQAYPELNSPLNFFPIINHDLEKYNSKYRNTEKSKIFSSVLFGFEKNSNAKLGKYLRKRIGLASGESFTDKNLKNYGRDHFDLTLMDEGIYYADFSVKNINKTSNDFEE